MWLEEAPPVKALYFAVAACSTAGLQGPSADRPWSVVGTALYVSIGVPLYGYALGLFAGALTRSHVRRKGARRRLQAISHQEFDHMNRLGNGDGRIDRLEFTLLWMLRNGRCTPDDLRALDSDFDALDADGTGYFTRSEMQVACAFDTFDRDHDGDLTLRDMCAIALTLQATPALEYPGRCLLDPRRRYSQGVVGQAMCVFDQESSLRRGQCTGSGAPVQVRQVELNRKEFMRWWVSEFRPYVQPEAPGGALPLARGGRGLWVGGGGGG